jgi:uncharacterized protein with gpF-like domain
MATNPIIIALNLPFDEAIEFLRSKVNIPTTRWDDMLNEAHDIGFMVASATDADLLSDFREAIDKAVSIGTTIQEFKNDFDRIVEERGWTGWTGEDSAGGRAWRQRVIYDTNVRQSHNAGREQQMADPDLLKLRPIRVYRHGDSIVPRKSHLALDGFAALATDPIWDKIAPANGYMCSCYSQLLSVKEAQKRGIKVHDDLPPEAKSFEPDKGFDYRPGSNDVQRVYDNLREKSDSYTPELKSFFLKSLEKGKENGKN